MIWFQTYASILHIVLMIYCVAYSQITHTIWCWDQDWVGLAVKSNMHTYTGNWIICNDGYVITV